MLMFRVEVEFSILFHSSSASSVFLTKVYIIWQGVLVFCVGVTTTPWFLVSDMGDTEHQHTFFSKDGIYTNLYCICLAAQHITAAVASCV